ncbi:LuxR family transcriptional regulator [Cereibacter sphaeroides]|uniref:LuxR family transcriptional regulator n=1 Tax=Cereibacter sphaeroides TaxID=1063 RepID=UPI001F2A8E9C|nr:LuxR family transcriptional regulator [Cereibacter sphaeroides]
MLKRIGPSFGIRHFTYFGNASCDGTLDDNVILTSYPDAWQGRYREMDYHMTDPVVAKGLTSILPLDWSLVPRSSPLIRQFFGEAAELGILPSGLTVPIRDALNNRALFSVNVDVPEKDWPSFKRAFISDVTYLGFLFHDRVISALKKQQATKPKRLSPREIEVLRWAALGKSAWETGRIMGLTEGTVNFYVSNAIAKLGVVNKTHAVARCLDDGIFQLRAPLMETGRTFPRQKPDQKDT